MVSARPSAAASDARFGARPAAGASPDHLLTPDRPDPAPARPAKSKGKSMTVNIRNWQELKKPSNLKIKTGSAGKRKATCVAEPPERSFGLTLGNALRRGLPASLPGSTEEHTSELHSLMHT